MFAPSLFVGVTSGMAFGEIADHGFGPGTGQPALYAVVAMGAVFTSAARAPLTQVASVVEMTSVLHGRRPHEPHPDLVLAPGDRIGLLSGAAPPPRTRAFDPWGSPPDHVITGLAGLAGLLSAGC